MRGIEWMGLTLLVALLACKQSDDEGKTEEAKAEPKGAGDSAEAAGKKQKAASPAPAEPVSIASGNVDAAKTADGARWVSGFRYELPSGAPQGSSWLSARKACQSASLDLCSAEQWELVCQKDAAVGKAPSWTVSADGSGFKVMGGSGCAASTSAAPATAAPGRIGLCCERRAAIKVPSMGAGHLKAARVYLELVDKAMHASDSMVPGKLWAQHVQKGKTPGPVGMAMNDFDAERKKYPVLDHRFLRCECHVLKDEGHFECDTLAMRQEAGKPKTEVTTYRARFEYGWPDRKYSLWNDPVRVIIPWANVD